MQETLYYREQKNNTIPSNHQRKYHPSDTCFGPIKLPGRWLAEVLWVIIIIIKSRPRSSKWHSLRSASQPFSQRGPVLDVINENYLSSQCLFSHALTAQSAPGLFCCFSKPLPLPVPFLSPSPLPIIMSQQCGCSLSAYQILPHLFLDFAADWKNLSRMT